MDRKQEILQLLKRQASASLSEVAGRLGISKQGALRHLDALAAQGLVETTPAELTRAEHRGPGRPGHVYRLTAAAAAVFPSGHRELAKELVDFMADAELQRFFAARAARVEASYARELAGLDLHSRIRELARLASEAGHMTEVIEEGGGRLALRHCNCPIQDVAALAGHPCRQEQQMYERLLGAQLARSSWLGEGDASCTYEITTTATATPKTKGKRELELG